jgi:hypothetical protein
VIENDKEKPMENETTQKPSRQKPKVKVTTVDFSEAEVKPRKPRKPKENLVPASSKGMTSSSKIILLMLGAFLAGSGLTYAITANPEPVVTASTSTFSDITTGKVALSEKELISAVAELGVDVYWAGPVDGAKYTLSVPAEGQAYVRYLPNGEGINDTAANYVVIATYATPDAFASTQAAGNQTNGVTFINAQGAAVFYSKETPTNVYVAYPNIDFQIEVFSPIAKTALDIASKQGALRLVK